MDALFIFDTTPGGPVGLISDTTQPGGVTADGTFNLAWQDGTVTVKDNADKNVTVPNWRGGWCVKSYVPDTDNVAVFLLTTSKQQVYDLADWLDKQGDTAPGVYLEERTEVASVAEVVEVVSG
jgi:hypothetical protein